MTSSERNIAGMDRALESKLATFGALHPDVFFRVMPAIIDETVVLWPANAIGRVRLIRRPRGLLFVTQGLSYPFDDLHADGPERLGYELGVEVGIDEPLAPSDARVFGEVSHEEYAASWPVRMLWFLADAYVHDRWDLLPRLEHFGMLTTMCRALPGLAGCTLGDDLIGLLVGAPFDDEVLPSDSRLVMLQLLMPDEYAWATSVPDSSRVHALAAALGERGVGHVSSAVRPSLRL